MPTPPTKNAPGRRPAQPLTVERTVTGYWTVQRDGVPLAGAMTRTAAERECEMLSRLGLASSRRAGSRTAIQA
jgi:hypothetical protein